LITDEDKERLSAARQERDHQARLRREGARPGPSGYRFARHPATLGEFRGDDPFKDSLSMWRPPSAEQDGHTSQCDLEQAPTSALLDKSHSMRKSRSSPSLQNIGQQTVAEAGCHPMCRELERWERLATFTKSAEMKGMPEPNIVTTAVRKSPRPIQAPRAANGLVNFPKYMMWNNCHMKQTDLQRYVETEAAARQAAEDAAQWQASSEGDDVRSRADGEECLSPARRGRGSPQRWEPPSWGAPKLRGVAPGTHVAGSAMPAGKCQRSSNPFRTG